MNRLQNYLSSIKLARLHNTEALSQNGKGKPDNAIRHLAEAQLNMMVALNNVVSIAFKAKPKKPKGVSHGV